MYPAFTDHFLAAGKYDSGIHKTLSPRFEAETLLLDFPKEVSPCLTKLSAAVAPCRPGFQERPSPLAVDFHIPETPTKTWRSRPENGPRPPPENQAGALPRTYTALPGPTVTAARGSIPLRNSRWALVSLGCRISRSLPAP